MRFANQTIAFRVDASLEIGTGHVMRCLTLAEAAREMGATVFFISRELAGNMIDQMEARGFPVAHLSAPDGPMPEGPPAHAEWAGVRWEQDAAETCEALDDANLDWLIVDHYAFDERWETAMRRNDLQIMVIDDLADRPHDCDLLLDQNLGREATDYEFLVPNHCKSLIGPRYALLRPEFAVKRSESLSRRQGGRLEHILVTMGGIDQDNITGHVIEAIQNVNLPPDCRITVVLGRNAPWFEEVKLVASGSKVPTTVLQAVEDMATLMSDADLAIGGAGSTAWERCCVGLPTLLMIVAANQCSAAKALTQFGAAEELDSDQRLDQKLNEILIPQRRSRRLRQLSSRSALVADGLGTARVLGLMETAK